MNKIKNAIQELQENKDRIQVLHYYWGKLQKIENQRLAQFIHLKQKNIKQEDPILKIQSQIIQGLYKPKEQELKDAQQFLKINESINLQSYQPKVLQNYWFTSLCNHRVIRKTIQVNDYPLMKCLQNIQLINLQNQAYFTLIFHFSQNDYFENEYLKKSFLFGKDQIMKADGTQIIWKSPEKNLTQKQITKKQIKRKTGQIRTITKKVQIASFFNFFKSAQINMQIQQMDEQIQKIKYKMEWDYQIGNHIEQIIYQSFDYYLNVKHQPEDNNQKEEILDKDKMKKLKKKKKAPTCENQ